MARVELPYARCLMNKKLNLRHLARYAFGLLIVKNNLFNGERNDFTTALFGLYKNLILYRGMLPLIW